MSILKGGPQTEYYLTIGNSNNYVDLDFLNFGIDENPVGEIELEVEFDSGTNHNISMSRQGTTNTRLYITVLNSEIIATLGDNQIINSNVFINYNQVYNIRLEYSNGNATLYVDNNNVGSTTYTVNTGNNDFKYKLGTNPAVTDNKDLFNLYYYRHEVSGFNLVEYNFNEGSGQILNDDSGNNNDATIVGATWVDSGQTTLPAIDNIYYGAPQLNTQEADYIISASFDNTVRKIDSSGNQIWSFTSHTDNLNHVAVDDNEFIYTASLDNTVRKIDLNGNEVWSFTGHNSAVRGISVDQNGNVYSGGDDTTIIKIDSNGNTVWTFTGHSQRIRSLAVDINGNVYSASDDTTVRKIDPNGNEIWSFNGNPEQVFDVAVDQNGNVYSAGFDDTVRKIDSSGNQVWSFTGHTANVTAVKVDQNGNVYSASDDFSVRKLDSDGNQLWSFTGHNNKVFGLAVDLAGNVYSGGDDNNVRKLDSNGNELWVFTNHTERVRRIAVSQPLPLTTFTYPTIDRVYAGSSLVYGEPVFKPYLQFDFGDYVLFDYPLTDNTQNWTIELQFERFSSYSFYIRQGDSSGLDWYIGQQSADVNNNQFRFLYVTSTGLVEHPISYTNIPNILKIEHDINNNQFNFYYDNVLVNTKTYTGTFNQNSTSTYLSNFHFTDVTSRWDLYSLKLNDNEFVVDINNNKLLDTYNNDFGTIIGNPTYVTE